MKIFYVANVRLPSDKAHALQIARMTESLIEKGTELTLVVPWRGQKIDVQKTYFLRVKVPVVYVPVISIAPSTSIGFNLLSLSFGISATLYLLFKKFSTSFLIYTIDLDQFSYAFFPLVAKTVAEVHGSKRKSFFTKFFFTHASVIFAVSDHVRESLKEMFHPKGFLTTLRNGIDLDVFNPRGAKIPEVVPKVGRPVFLYVGRVYAWKGLATIVDALLLDKDGLELVFVGGTKDELEKMLGKKVPENMHCVGKCPPQEIPAWLLWADFFLVCGTAKDRYSYFETSPMKLFEYLAYGKPIIAVDSPAIHEVVDESEVLFYKADDPKDLLRAMRYVKEHREELSLRKERLMEKAKQYTWSLRAEKALDILKKQG